MSEGDYTVVVHPNPPSEGGGFLATVPDLPGCMSEAVRNAADAISQWIAEAVRLGRSVPLVA